MVTGSKATVFEALEQFLSKTPGVRTIGIKINLPSLPKLHSPRTDISLLSDTVHFLVQKGYYVYLLEGAAGNLRSNLIRAGLQDIVLLDQVSVIDTDLEGEVTIYERNGRRYALPNVLKDFDIRMAVPCASKRRGYLFSCNVKTFVGLLPRKYCTSRGKFLAGYTRPLVHEDIDNAVADIFSLFSFHSPFHLYLNGGNTYSEYTEMRELPQFFLSQDALALDLEIASLLHAEPPAYLLRLKKARETMNDE